MAAKQTHCTPDSLTKNSDARDEHDQQGKYVRSNHCSLAQTRHSRESTIYKTHTKGLTAGLPDQQRKYDFNIQLNNNRIHCKADSLQARQMYYKGREERQIYYRRREDRQMY